MKKQSFKTGKPTTFLVELGDATKVVLIAVEDTKPDTVQVEKKSIERIFKSDNYIEESDNIALGMFIPIYIIEFENNICLYRIEFSVANAEVKVFCNGKFKKSVLMSNPDKLVNAIESLL